MTDKEVSVDMALRHIVDACSGLTREQCMIAATALQAGWLTSEERTALADLASGLNRLSVAGAS